MQFRNNFGKYLEGCQCKLFKIPLSFKKDKTYTLSLPPGSSPTGHTPSDASVAVLLGTLY